MSDANMDSKNHSDDDFKSNTKAQINGVRLKELRLKVGYSQETLAAEAEINEKTVRSMENAREGKPYPTRRSIIYMLAKALKVEAGELLVPYENTHPAEKKASPRAKELSTAAQSFASTAEEVIEVLPINHPHQSFLAAHWDSVSGNVETSRPQHRVKSVIEAVDYRTCLERLADEDRDGIRAIADLTDPIEFGYWFSNESEPRKTWVRERIFWVDWDMVFDPNTFPNLMEMLHRQARYRPDKYEVRLGISGEWRAVEGHPLGDHAIGKHLLLIEPTLVGGYEERPTTHRKMNVILSDRRAFEDAQSYYTKIHYRSIKWEAENTETSARQAIYGIDHLGTFDEKWEDHANRPPRYFDLYEQNIRLWNPWYQDTTYRCCRAVQHEILARYNVARPSIRLLEVGFGTGGLTRPLLAWVAAANELAVRSHHGQFVDKYFGIDPASQMLERASRNVQRNELCVFERGRYGRNNITRLTGSHNVEIIFGSLVLHDILGQDLSRNVPLFFKVAQECLAEKGALVFADVLFSSDSSVRAKELDCWRRRMRVLGLGDVQIVNFLDRNPEMVETATEEMLNEVGSRHGFSPAEVQPETKEDHIPFKIITIRRE